MKYRFEVKQTVYKYVDIEASNEGEACEKIEEMIEECEIRFDDEPFLKTECNHTLVPLEDAE